VTIVQAGDPVLRRSAARVHDDALGSPELTDLIETMVWVLSQVPGVGLAAPQLGVPLRVVVVQDPPEFHAAVPAARFGELEREIIAPYVLINPEIAVVGDETRTFFEGCLSVDGYRALVERARTVGIRWTDPDGNRHEAEHSGWHARILQHEIDHLDGILYVDRMLSRSFMTIAQCGEWVDERIEAVLEAFGIT
jgi:peptide deformylase